MSIYPIVGDHYHPPAKAILQIMPIGTELSLIAEPENPHDPNAIMVVVFSRDLPEEKDSFDQYFMGYGMWYSLVIAEECWHLGYLPRPIAAKLAPFSSATGRYCTGADGGPKVELK